MKKCYHCAYYKALAGGYDGNKACHYLLANGHSRQRTKTECLSYIPDNKENRKIVREKTSQISKESIWATA